MSLALSLVLSYDHSYGYLYTCSEADFRVGVALADHSCVVYTAGETFSKTATLKHNESSIIGTKFCSSRNIIYIASNNGNIVACDLRAKGKVIAEFKGLYNDFESCVKHI